MDKTTYCVVTVDTNDGDYEEYKTEITEENGDRLDEFTSLLQHLPKQENYYYHNGKKVCRGNKVYFESNVGEDSIHGGCGLKALLVDKDEWKEGLWEEEEVHEEGMITPEEFKVLEEFLPMYIDGGFHSITSVTLEERYEPTILKKYEL